MSQQSAKPERAHTVGTFAAIRRLYPYVKPAMPHIYLGMTAALAAGIVALLIPQVLRSLVDGPLQSGDSSEIWPAFFTVLGLGIVEAVMIALRRYFVLTPGTHVEARMRNTLYMTLQHLPVSFHDRWPSGQLLSRAVSDLNLIRRWLSFGLVLLVVNVLTIIVGLIFLVNISWVLGTIFILSSIPLWIYGFVFEKRYSIVARRSQDQTGDLATAVEEAVHGIRVLKAFGRGKHALAGFSVRANDLRGTEIEKARAVAGIWLWLLLVPDVTFALSLLGGVWLVVEGNISAGDLVAFFATATVLRFPVESIGFLLSMTFDTRTAADRFFEVMDTENPITDPENPKTITHSKGHLEFTGVHFRYPDSPANVPDLINGVDLSIEPGETMALVGLTGSGKSTLTALTTRLYDVTAGSISVDGVDIRDLTLNELRRHLAMAFEDATLFSSSVRENVLMGRPDSSEEELREALSIAQADFVYDLPAGLDTLVGEEGLSLSGGQRQRLALARAIAAQPAVLVLDDPLSALDVDTEALVEAALRKILSSTTGLIVAHRPSTVMLADRVALLEDGRVTAVGKHPDLLATSSHYRYVISSLEEEEQEARS
ncbi:putative ABC transporter ATP-binding protein [Leifsonia rubra CMS 76R]|nr:putative ABC transporter ATP-binding protein [Leifsonia rubra CMS 76R]